MLALETQSPSVEWQPTEGIDRGFVRYLNPTPSPGWVWKETVAVDSPILSVVIPTADADRGGYFLKLMKQISQQDFQGFELIVVRGDSRQGRAENKLGCLPR